MRVNEVPEALRFGPLTVAVSKTAAIHARTVVASTIVAIAFAFSGCVDADELSTQRMQQDTRALESLIPRLERFHVRVVRNQDWCQVLADDRGVFATDLETTTCNLWGPGDKFDAAATAAFEDLQAAMSGTGTGVYLIDEIERDANGAVVAAFFTVDRPEAGSGYMRYVFEPGAALPADGTDLDHTRIDARWYLQMEDWM
jgi:hypothetical protein